MQFKYIFIFALAVTFSISSNADELIGTMGCESKGGTNVFILLYGKNGKYTKICQDNIGNSSMAPMECRKAFTSATEIYSEYSYSRVVTITLQRKTLDLEIKERKGGLIGRRLYQCIKSKDPESVENFVKNAKQNQLKENQF